jgi:hypothetical protein
MTKVIQNTLIRYDDTVVTIVDSYKVTNKDEMFDILIDFIIETKYHSKRNINSWLKEWKAHNRLYKLGLFRSHTKDCDFEENEAWWRLLIYEIIGR